MQHKYACWVILLMNSFYLFFYI